MTKHIMLNVYDINAIKYNHKNEEIKKRTFSSRGIHTSARHVWRVARIHCRRPPVR